MIGSQPGRWPRRNRSSCIPINDDGSGNSLTVVDISTPAIPTVVGSVQDPGPSNRLFGSYGVAQAALNYFDNYALAAPSVHGMVPVPDGLIRAPRIWKDK